MIFKDTWQQQQVLDGNKTQTRRIVKDGDYLIDWPMPCIFRNDRLLWRVGQIYAVQPGRGKKGIGKIGIVNIKREELNNITEKDAIAEGVRKVYRCPEWLPSEARHSFVLLWNGIYAGTEFDWYKNPEVWVLEFELIQEA
jgi:hypothetical protein